MNEYKELIDRAIFLAEEVARLTGNKWDDQTVAVEVQQRAGKLELRQQKFFATFKGMKAILRTTGDVVALYRELRRRHDLIFQA